VITSLVAIYFILVPAVRKLPKFNEVAREKDDSDEVTNDVS